MLRLFSNCVLFGVLFVCVVFGQRKENNSNGGGLQRCQFVVPSATGRTIAYINWPFKLSCEELVESSQVALDSPSSQCFVQSNNLPRQSADEAITLSATSPLIEIFTVTQVINRGRCFSTNITVERRPLPSRSCFDDVKYFVSRDVNVIHRSIKFGQTITLECVPGQNAGNEAIFPPAVPSSEYTTTWWRSKRHQNSSIDAGNACMDYTTLARRTFLVDQVKHSGRPDSLVRYSANFYDPAIYSCQVEHNGQTAFVSHYSVCVENEVRQTKPTVMCNEVVTAFEGECVEIECSVLSSNAKITPGQLQVEWRKEGGDSSYECETSFLSNYRKSRASKSYCNVKNFLNKGTKCFDYVPSTRELSMHPDLNTFKIRYSLRNFQRADAGRYRVDLKYQDAWSDPTFIDVTFVRRTLINQDLRRLYNLVKNVDSNCETTER